MQCGHCNFFSGMFVDVELLACRSFVVLDVAPIDLEQSDSCRLKRVNRISRAPCTKLENWLPQFLFFGEYSTAMGTFVVDGGHFGCGIADLRLIDTLGVQTLFCVITVNETKDMELVALHAVNLKDFFKLP